MPQSFSYLIVPGLHNSGPNHWQSRWEADLPDCRRVQLGRWDAPERDQWCARLHDAVTAAPAPVLLIAHSLGCLAVAWWGARVGHDAAALVAGALLVAPPDVEAEDADPLLRPFAPAPRRALPFPSILVASRNDHYARFDRLRQIAANWGSRLHDAGAIGHINADSGIGAWPEGRALLASLAADAQRPDRRLSA